MTKILIVEDDRDINDLLYDKLKNDFSVVQSYSGTDGLKMVLNDDIDLVITDLMLPGITGEELIPLIKEKKDIPILVITAKSEIDVLVDVLSLGADDYLSKPFDMKELVARLKVQLRKKYVNSNIIKYKELLLDLKSYQLLYNGGEIDLLQKEFEIMKLFLSEPTRIFTKEFIYQKVWKEEYYNDDNTINVHISRLRKKINTALGKECIKTIWGLGYKLVI